MIMNKYIVALTAICTLFFSACTKQLDIPQKGVVAYETYYTSDEAAEAALVNVYARLVQSVYGSVGNWNPYFFMLNYSADDVFAAGKNKDDHLDVRLFNEYRYDATYDIIKRVYTSLYHTIYACNLVIDNFTKEGAYSSPVVDRCVAEAMVVRAWCHMTAALTWQRPPLVDHCLTDEEPTNVESQKFLLDWCIKECETAIPNLRERSGTSDKDATTYATKGFAQFVAGAQELFPRQRGLVVGLAHYAGMQGDDEFEGGAVVNDLPRDVILALIAGKQDGSARVFDDVGGLVLTASGIDGHRDGAVVECSEVGNQDLGAVLGEQAHAALFLNTVDKQRARSTVYLFAEAFPSQ